MNRKVSYEDCLRFIENNLDIKLFAFQKEIIKCFCEGKEIRTARGIGRSMCADAFGEYIAHLYDRNDYDIEPEVAIPYQIAVRDGVWTEEIIEACRGCMSEEDFEREFCCK